MKKLFFICLGLSLAALLSYLSLEPSIIKAASSTATSTVTLIVTSELSIAVGGDVTMTPNLSMSQDTSVGSTTFLVKTNDTAGYTLTLKASTTPAMRNGVDSFSDAATTTGPALWSTQFGGVNTYQFGFSAFGTDARSVWGNSATASTTCSWAGSGTAAITDDGSNPRKWTGFYYVATSTATRTSETAKAGIYTTICFVAEQGDNVYAPSGTYTASAVGTATTN